MALSGGVAVVVEAVLPRPGTLSSPAHPAVRAVSASGAAAS